MTVKRVDTLGCHPLVLMKKLEAIGGLEILTEEKFTFNSVDYPHRTIAKVKDGLYVETEDVLFSGAVSEATIPQRAMIVASFSSQTPFSKFEAAEEDRNALIDSASPYVPQQVEINNCPVVSPSENPTSISILVSLPPCEEAYSGSFPTGVSLGSKTVDLPSVVITGELGEGLELAEGSNHSCFLKGVPTADNPPLPFGILTASLGSLSPSSVLKSAVYPSGSVDYTASDIILISGSRIRIAGELTEAGELLNPSEWTELPIFTSILSSEKGLAFFVSSSTGSMLVASTVDTSKGNGFGENPPVVYRKTPLAANITGRSPEACHVIGSSGNPVATKSMCAYRPAPPVANDSISGGPVVTDIFAYDLEEVRGTIPGVLSCSENLPIGTVGWLEGKRYRVTVPGTMLQIG